MPGRIHEHLQEQLACCAQRRACCASCGSRYTLSADRHLWCKMSGRLAQQFSKLADQSIRTAHTMTFGKGVNYFPSLSKHGRPVSISQGSQAQRDVRSSMSDPDMFLNYTPTSAVSDAGRQARHSFPGGVHVPEGGRLISTPDYPEPLRNSMTDADVQLLRRDMWPRNNVPILSAVPHRTSALPEPLQNSLADAEYLDTRARR